MKRVLKASGLTIVLTLVAALLPGSALGAGYTARMSVDSNGAQATGGISIYPAISADGRYVVFESFANNLVTGDANLANDIFLRDRKFNTTTRLSVGPGGVEGNDSSEDPEISPNGRYAGFASLADNLVSNDTNTFKDLFVRDLKTGVNEIVSLASDGTQANEMSVQPDFSTDGRYVAFASFADNLSGAGGDNNFDLDVFVRDRKKHTTERVSVSSGGGEVHGGQSSNPSLSADGRYVAFQSEATDVMGAGNDSNGRFDVFVHDRKTHITTRASVGLGGAEALHGDSYNASLSADGRFVAFQSTADNLVAGDGNDLLDVFVYDRATGVTQRVSVGLGGVDADGASYMPSISDDGIYVTYYSNAANLVSGDANGGIADVFVYNRKDGATALASTAADGAQGDQASLNPVLSGDGRYVTFESIATNLLGAGVDTNTVKDVFLVCNPVVIPVLASPADSAALAVGKDKVKLVWRAPAGLKKKLVSKYEVQVAWDAAFNFPFKTVITKKTSYQLKGLTPNTPYYWRVRAVYKDGTACNWAPYASGSWTFNVPMTVPPRLLKPRNGSKEKNPAAIVFSWKRPKGVPKNTVYDLQFSTDPNFNTGTTIGGISATKYKLTNDPLPILPPVSDPPVQYYWRARAASSSGLPKFSDWSQPRMFLR